MENLTNISVFVVTAIGTFAGIYFGIKALLKSSFDDKLSEVKQYDEIKKRVAILESRVDSTDRVLKLDLDEIKELIKNIDNKLYNHIITHTYPQ